MQQATPREKIPISRALRPHGICTRRMIHVGMTRRQKSVTAVARISLRSHWKGRPSRTGRQHSPQLMMLKLLLIKLVSKQLYVGVSTLILKLKKAVTGRHWKMVTKNDTKNQTISRPRKQSLTMSQRREVMPVRRRMKRHMEILMRLTAAKKVTWLIPPICAQVAISA